VLKGIEFDGWNSLPACGSRIAFFGMEDWILFKFVSLRLESPNIHTHTT
jgi:hypothetical protein